MINKNPVSKSNTYIHEHIRQKLTPSLIYRWVQINNNITNIRNLLKLKAKCRNILTGSVSTLCHNITSARAR